MWVRPQDPDPSLTESARAVRPVEFQESQAEGKLPEEDQVRQANATARDLAPEPHVGGVLDTVA
jgi:hypothetical protein